MDAVPLSSINYFSPPWLRPRYRNWRAERDMPEVDGSAPRFWTLWISDGGRSRPNIACGKARIPEE